MEAHIYLYGEITGWQDDDIGMWGCVNLKDIKNQVDAAPEADTLVVHINSFGGDLWEGWGIHDYLKNTGKKIITIVEGVCMSAATLVFMSGSERRITENSTFMIHFPWTYAVGNSADLAQFAEELIQEENRIVDFYMTFVSATEEEIRDLMKDEEMMMSQKVFDLGFATELVKTVNASAFAQRFTVAACAKKLSLKNNTMTKEKEPTLEERILNVLKNLGIKKQSPKNIVLTTADGETELDFGDSAETVEQIEVGDTATVDGEAASGEYTMPDGTVYVFENGELMEIKEPDADADDADDADPDMTVEQRLEALETALQNNAKTIGEVATLVKDVNDSVTTLKDSIGSGTRLKPIVNNKDDKTEPEPRRVFKKTE